MGWSWDVVFANVFNYQATPISVAAAVLPRSRCCVLMHDDEWDRVVDMAYCISVRLGLQYWLLVAYDEHSY